MFPMASMTTETASSSSSLPQREYQYDVFVSFRGKDTRNKFTDHLYDALDRKEIKTFRDDKELERGKPIRPELLTAIEESRFAVIILSRNYASSTWCLDELAKIVECMKQTRLTVLPVFYHVHPSDVRNLRKRSFAQAFAEHEERFKENRERVQRWMDALIEVADASGWHVKDGPETKVIEEIVGKILDKLNSRVPPIVSDGLFGIESRVEEMMNSYLGIGVDDVRFVGICGMGGIGKTTLARAVYERIACQFDANCFLANVREEAEKHGLVALQKQLLSGTIQTESTNIMNEYEGANAISNRLCCKKVLIILDDVDQLEQLRALVKEGCWFGGGSRIIVTTRNKRLLIEHDVAEDGIYEAKELNGDEALQLFCRKAFKEDSPPKDFVELSKKFLNYAKGLPLALEVLGSSMYKRSEGLWKSTLTKLKEIPDEKIHDKLQLSFDGLPDLEKKIFLDIACFFKGEDKDRVEDILESFGYHPKIGIDNLINKSLITISIGKKLWLHDLLEEMGREIVRRESFEEPSGRSRLWYWKDIHRVLKNNTGTERVEAIALTYADGPYERLPLNAEAFSKLPNLRFLKINYPKVELSEGLSYLPNKLQAIDWYRCPLKSLPMSFSLDKLVVIRMPFSKIEEIWKGKKCLPKLKILDLSYSVNLIKTPNFTEAPNLEKLIFEGCQRLHEVHPSVGGLKQLTILNWKGCTSLTSLPCNISLDSLEALILSGCSKLEKVPKIVKNMKRLKRLYLDGTAIKELPLSIGHLSGLTLLNLDGCMSLTSLPCNISLDSLEVLFLSGCWKLEKVPEIVENMKRLKRLSLDRTAIKELPLSIGHLSGLTSLSLNGCKSLTSLPCNISLDSLEVLLLYGCSRLEKVPKIKRNMKRLKVLNLGGTAIKDLPSSIGRLSGLTFLDLRGCKSLTSLPDTIGRLSVLTKLDLERCISLTSLPSNISLDSLEDLNLSGCSKLKKFPKSIGNMKRLKILNLSGTAIKKLSLSIERLSILTLLDLAYCKSLLTLPSVVCNLTSLQYLYLHGCSKVDKLPKEFGNLKQLKVLLVGGTAIRQLPSLPSSIQSDSVMLSL